MSKEIDSEALVLLRKGLGIGGIGSPTTLLEEEFVSQTVDVAQFARQGLPPGNGLFYYRMEVTTSVANPSLNLAVDVYNPTDGTLDFNLPPYPLRVPSTLDVWLIHASMAMTLPGVFVDASLSLVTEVSKMGIGIHNNDTTVATITQAAMTVPLCVWNRETAVNGFEIAGIEGGATLQHLGIRVARGSDLQVRVDAGGINGFNWNILAALMPRSMGQDVSV